MYQSSCSSVAKSSLAFWDLKDCSTAGFLVLHYLPEFAQINVHWVMMLSNHLILCCPLLVLLSIWPSIRVFFSESALHIRWPSTGASALVLPYSGLISFRMDWFYLLAVQGTLKSLLQHHTLKASILWHSPLFMVSLSHSYMTTGKIIALTRWTFVGKVMSLLFNMLSRVGHNFPSKE